MTPTVTVIIPAYNCERFVAEAIRSAAAQEHVSTEILVIDDGSTDGTPRELAEFSGAVRIVRVPNGGPAKARNLGMQLARGEFIAFLDADDVWAHGKLAAQVRHLRRLPEVGACYCDWHIWPADLDGQWTRPTHFVDDVGLPVAIADRSGWIYEQLLFDCQLLTTTVMLRTSVAREVGEFDAGLRVGEDYDYWLRLSQRTRIDRLGFCGALYRVVPGSESRRPHVQNHELIVVQRAIERFGLSSPSGHRVSETRLAVRLRQLVVQHAWAHLRAGDPAIARRGYGKCLVKRPWNLALWGRWVQALGLSVLRPVRATPA